MGSETEEEHVVTLRKNFTTLFRKEIRLKFSKSAFGKKEVEILWHGVSPKGVSPFAGYAKAIRNSVKPSPEMSWLLSWTHELLFSIFGSF